MTTRNDVAREAKVSSFVVSKVLNNTWREEHIGEECVERVRAAVELLQYVPNHAARALRSGSTRTVGLVLQSTATRDYAPFSMALLQGVESILAEREQDLLIIGRSGAQMEVDHGLECLAQRRVDALVIPGMMPGLHERSAAIAAKGPIVLALRIYPSAIPAVDVDPSPGIAAAVGHLKGLGHRGILWFGVAPEHGRTSRDRLKRLRAAAAGQRVSIRDETLALQAVFTYEHWVELARLRFIELWSKRPRATAVMCYNDAMALGVCRAAHDLGVHVPRELSVVGFDDFLGEICVPSLTTISHMLPEIGRRAAELAMARSRGPALPEQVGMTELIPSRLVLRKSTAAPPGGGGNEAAP